MQTLEGHRAEVSAVTFSPNGRLLTSASRDNTVKLWDVATGALQGSLEDHTDYVNEVIFSPNDQLLASTSGDMKVKL